MDYNILCIKQQSYGFSLDLWKIDCGQILTLSDHPSLIVIYKSMEPFKRSEFISSISNILIKYDNHNSLCSADAKG